jgi:predicted PurR-regulated permease PerM
MDKAAPPGRKYDLDRVVRLVLTTAGAIGFFLLVRYLSDVLVPFAIALLLAYLLNPIVTLLESRLGRRLYAVALTLGGMAIVMLSIFIVLVPLVTREVESFRAVVREFAPAPSTIPADDQGATTQPGGRSLRERYETFVARQDRPLVRQALSYVPEWLAQIDVPELAGSAARRLMPGLLGVVSGLLSLIAIVTGVIIAGVYLVFLLLDYPQLAANWKSFLPPAYRDEIIRFLEEFQRAMSRYFRGQFVVAAATGILMAIGFVIIGLPMGALLGLAIGVLAMIPYMQAVGLIPAVLLAVLRALEQDSSVFWSIALVLIVFGVVQLIQDTLLTPRIMGKATGLQPAVILLGVFIWGKLLGFLGLVLAIPLTCLAIAYYRRLVLGRRERTVTA